MDALEFIEKDNARHPSSRAAAGIALVVAVLPVALGLGMRADLIGVFEPRILMPNLTGALLAGAAVGWGVARRSSSPLQLRLAVGALLAAAILAVERVFFPGGARTTYASTAQFWREGAACFSKGSVTTLCLGAALCAFAFAAAPLPTRKRRALVSAVAGVGGAVMLGFHCDSSSVAHVAVGHLAGGLIFGCALFAFQELVVGARLSKLFPRLKNPGRLS